MTSENPAATVAEWATKSGSVWARRWRDTDAGLAGLSPNLLAAVNACAPARPFRAFDIGCGPGTTTIEVAVGCPDAEIIACDVSPDLAEIARRRTVDLPRVRVVEGDAEALAASENPFDLFFSRHGVMFFPDPVGAFRSFRNAANPGASIVFSCFQSWEANPWASELASAAAATRLPSPGREPSGFAFADPDYVRGILETSGWSEAAPQDVKFDYVAADGANPVEAALGFFTELGPSSRVLESLAEDQREAAVQRMRNVIEAHYDGTAVVFPAAAWIWTAKASAS
jgi:ubiquinone/menaquinone biosynthesis C-methylase UbiE